MGIKAGLKEARARMQAGDPAQALSMIRNILDSGSPELKDAQTMYAVLVTAGMAGLAAEDYSASEASFRKATDVVPDAPQAWKGLIDCLERAGKLEALPEALLPAAQIAEGKMNFARARSMRLRLAEVLEGLGRGSEALEVLLKHLDNPDARIPADTDNSPAEQLVMVLHAAVLHDAEESAAVTRKVEKRLAKEIGICAGGGEGEGKSDRATLAFEYQVKALEKDDADGGPVARRFEDAMQALEAAGAATKSDIARGAGRESQGSFATRQHNLVVRYVRGFLRRAVQRAECNRGGWQEVLKAYDRLSAMGVGKAGGLPDEGWLSTTMLIVSSYEPLPVDLHQLATDNAKISEYPWLMAESCLYLAWAAWSRGNGATAGTMMKTALAAKARAWTQNSSSTSDKDSWVRLSGPGSEWRELSLQCLVSQCLGYPGIGRDPDVASTFLTKLETADTAVEASLQLRGPPLGERDLSGGLALARASLLIATGQLDKARSAVKAASNALLHAEVHASNDRVEERPGPEESAYTVAPQDQARKSVAFRSEEAVKIPCLHCRALCVDSDVDLAEGRVEDAKTKLRAVIEADGGFAGALTRLGWLMLGFAKVRGADAGGGGAMVRGKGREGDVAEAAKLLERAVQEEPGSSMHAFRLARCYWEMGGEHLADRTYCFNLLLRAAKLNPSNAQAFEWLGHWYQRVGGDIERSRGCFSRAVKLDPELRGAGEALAMQYLENGQETLALGLFRNCAALSVACDWAWAGLSRVEMLEGKISEAATHLQQAIRGRPSFWSYWSDLGWCYHAEGKQAAALKAYLKAEELLESASGAASGASLEAGGVGLAACVRLKTQVGTIQRQIGQVDEAVSSFTQALQLNPNSGLALEGAGEAYLAQAHARTSEGLYTAATIALRNGCRVMRQFLGIDNDGRESEGSSPQRVTETGSQEHGCAWKLLGDLHTYAHKLPPMCFAAEEQGVATDVFATGTASAAAEQQSSATQESANRLAFVRKGAAAYQRAVDLLRFQGDKSSAPSPERLAAALYDLGLNYLLRARLVCGDAGDGSGLWEQEVYHALPKVVDLARSAEKAFKEAIEADPLHSESWNGLGAVSRDPLLQQHCWVRSVQLAHNASAWANISMLYVRWGLDIQAYESLGGLQAVTDHPTMWVGLGLLKEKEACEPNVTKVKKRRLLSQASDAYYSSLETGQHVDGLLGLGVTAGRTHSQSDALVALQQHLDLIPHSAQAWNYLGAAAELAGRNSQAVNAYRRALVLLQEQAAGFSRNAEGGGGEGAEDAANLLLAEAKQLTKRNLSRALAQQGMAEEAMGVLKDSNLGQETIFAEHVLQLGRAHAQRGDWCAALAAFQKVPTAGHEEVGALISTATTHYRKGDSTSAREAASTLMDKYPLNPRALLTAISVGALTADSGMAQHAARLLQTLPQRPSAADPDGRAERLAAEEALWALHLALRAAGAPSVASRRALCRAVHLSPSSVRAWARLGTCVTDSAVHFREAKSDDDKTSAKLARACVVVAKAQAMFTLRGKSRDAQGFGASGVAGTAGTSQRETSTRPDFTAQDLAHTLSCLATAYLCGGEIGSTDAALKAAARAVHLCPGEEAAWRCLAAALVGQAVCSPLDGDGAKSLLWHAHDIYRGISGEPRSDRDEILRYETAYTGLLLGAGKAQLEDATGDSSPDVEFARKLMNARSALSIASPATVERYKEVLRAGPDALLGWRELATVYGYSGFSHASQAAFECGFKVASGAHEQGKFSCQIAAPLRLQMAASRLASGEAEAGLPLIGDAFRVGKGGATGHVLRGLVNAQLGKVSLMAQSFENAKDAQPGIATFVDELTAAGKTIGGGIR